MNEEVLVQYAPIVLIVVAFLFKHKLFVTPEQMQKYVEERFLSLVAFGQFEKRIEDSFNNIDKKFDNNSKRFDKVDENLEHIKDLLIKRD